MWFAAIASKFIFSTMETKMLGQKWQFSIAIVHFHFSHDKTSDKHAAWAPKMVCSIEMHNATAIWSVPFTKDSLIKVNCDLFNSSTPLSCDLYLWQLKLIVFFGRECVTLFELSLSTGPVASFALRSSQVVMRHWQTFLERIQNWLNGWKIQADFSTELINFFCDFNFRRELRKCRQVDRASPLRCSLQQCYF